MNLKTLKKFAQESRKKLLDQIAKRLNYILSHDDEYLRAHSREKETIGKLIKEKGHDQFLEEVAYTWFNRFTALRFMDVRGYNRIRIISPIEDETQIQLLTEIKSGNIPQELKPYANRIFAYLNGEIASAQPEREAYQIALLAECNHLGSIMPFLFERIHDWATLLLPLDLLSSESVIADFQREIQAEDCKDVEIIGWLYQFYISEKKDQVISALKKNKKISRENIPPATQLFTPHWIVRYMAENSLGRLWLNNYSESSIRNRMEYFVEGDEEEDFIRIKDPLEIRILDPCCGSGHILVYAFDLLFDMYEEQGYSVNEIPSLILKNNLYGIDIDKRAAGLTSFALVMKARERDRNFLGKGILPNVAYSEDVNVDLREADISMSPELMIRFAYLKDATNLGSLIPVSNNIHSEILEIKEELEKQKDNGLFEKDTIKRIFTGLKQLEYLSTRYHCVITNPPYMGGKGMNEELKSFLKKEYEDYKSDLFAAFIRKGLNMVVESGYNAMVTMQSWMFLSSYEKMRKEIISHTTIINMAHLGPRAFDTIGGEVVQTTSFVIKKVMSNYYGTYLRLIDGKNEAEKRNLFKDKSLYFRSKASDFTKIPGSPIAYWVSEKVLNVFLINNLFGNVSYTACGMTTGNNTLYVRLWWEIRNEKIGINYQDRHQANNSLKVWFPYNKGGMFRKWYGNNYFVVNWYNDGKAIVNSGRAFPRAKNYYFRQSITWSFISSAYFGVRISPKGFIFDMAGCSSFPPKESLFVYSAMLISKVAFELLKIMNPTLNFQVGNIITLFPQVKIPFILNYSALTCPINR